jgi:phosphatidylglycerophosphatase A
VAALLLGLFPFSRGGVLLFFVAVTLGGTWAAHRAERLLGGKDPGAIVIDEVAGMTLAVLAFPLTPTLLAVGFVLFRLFDVVKPFPARASQRLPGGAGVMVDDLIAGLYALGALALLRAVMRWP